MYGLWSGASGRLPKAKSRRKKRRKKSRPKAKLPRVRKPKRNRREERILRTLQEPGDAGVAKDAWLQESAPGAEGGEGCDQHLGWVAVGRHAGAGRREGRAGVDQRSNADGNAGEEEHCEF